MAKKKVKEVKNDKNEAQTSAQQAPKKGGGLVLMITILFAVIVVAEVYFVMQKSARESKRPVFVSSLDKSYAGITSMGEYGSHIYVTNAENGEVRKIDKNTGKILQIIDVTDGAIYTLENMAGQTYVLTKKNSIIIYNENMKEIKRLALQGITQAVWFDIDKDDNIYVADGPNGKITSFDKDFNKLTTFGGNGINKDQFIGLAKLKVSSNGEIYAFESSGNNTGRMHVMSNTGKTRLVYKVDRLSKISFLTNFVITPDGYVYFNDFEGNCVVIYNPKGEYMGKFDTDTAKSFLITYPAAIAGGNNGLIYVATHRLGIFSPIKY